MAFEVWKGAKVVGVDTLFDQRSFPNPAIDL